jgi:hypothetical protein
VLEAGQHRGLAAGAPARRPRGPQLLKRPRDGPPARRLGAARRNPHSEPSRGQGRPPAPRGKKQDSAEPFERCLADAYARLLAGAPTTRSSRPELVVLASHKVTQTNWTDVREKETCKIPGVGPVSPQVAKQIASDAFLTGVFYDGSDLRHMRRWTRNTPVEVLLALEPGEPNSFDGVKCMECGNRFRSENDHLEPHHVHGPASTNNLRPFGTRVRAPRPNATARRASSGPGLRTRSVVRLQDDHVKPRGACLEGRRPGAPNLNPT